MLFLCLAVYLLFSSVLNHPSATICFFTYGKAVELGFRKFYFESRPAYYAVYYCTFNNNQIK